MNKRTFVTMILVCVLCLWAAPVQAHNPGWVIASEGMPPATVVNINGMEDDAVWAGITSFTIADYGDGTPDYNLAADVKAFHKSDGIYLLIDVTDGVFNNNDSVQIRFDINHNGSAMPEASDWGVQVLRSEQATQGPANASPATWSNVPAGNAGVTSNAAGWTVELRLPTGAPSNLSLATGSVGIHFMIYDIDQENGFNSAIYTQWPQPPAADINALLDSTPNQWGDYEFDPATTFPDIAVTGIRNNYDGSENFRKISHAATNEFQVEMNNPGGGTAVPDADGVRVNLYLASRGIGESWHRLDEASVLDGDCTDFSDADWPALDFTGVMKNEVCTGGSSSLPDVSTVSVNDIVDNTAMYTIKNGMPMNRVGWESETLAEGAGGWFNIIEWNTTAAQDSKYTEVMVGGSTYRLQHQCMKAEAIFSNDPNKSDNVRQANMDFVCVPGFAAANFQFSLGWAGFGKYDPDQGKEMLLHVDMINMDKELGWNYKLGGVKQLSEDVFIAQIRGKQSRSMQIGIIAPSPEIMGKTLKENLMVPPKAGGAHGNVKEKSGEPPVYVKVRSGSSITIANYSFDEKDEQFVDLDGERDIPSNGPEGLGTRWQGKVCRELKPQAPHIPTGALIGSFDNFRTAFLVGEGVLVKVPGNATHLALGINDCVAQYNDNAGIGFRVKITERSERRGTFGVLENLFATEAIGAEPARINTIPISEITPTLCVKGYEDIGQRRIITGKKPYELYRYLGNVCWTVINVFPRDRSEKPDQSDPFEEERGEEDKPVEPRPSGTCGKRSGGSLAFLFSAFGIAVIVRRIMRNRYSAKD